MSLNGNWRQTVIYKILDCHSIPELSLIVGIGELEEGVAVLVTNLTVGMETPLVTTDRDPLVRLKVVPFTEPPAKREKYEKAVVH